MLCFGPFKTTADWEFKDPDTGYEYKAKTKKELLQKILGYRTQNKLKVLVGLGAVVENYNCLKKGNEGKCIPNTKLERSWVATVRGGVALLANIFREKTVTQAEADKRSEICFRCPHNTFPDKGPFIKWADEIAVGAVGDKKSARHKDLGNCGLCSCPLRAKVWFEPPFKNAPEVDKKFPKFCWQKGK